MSKKFKEVEERKGKSLHKNFVIGKLTEEDSSSNSWWEKVSKNERTQSSGCRNRSNYEHDNSSEKKVKKKKEAT